MGRAPCCDKANVKKGPWSPEEDAKLKSYIEQHGTGGNWIALPQKIGLKRCGKSCRLRWLNYLRPNIKHGGFSEEEDNIICSLYISIGSRWSIIAAQLPGRTDNDIKNYWNTRLKKKLLGKQRKEHAAARRSSNSSASQKQEMLRKGREMINGYNMLSSSSHQIIHNNIDSSQNPYWPQLPGVLPPIPYSNEEPRFNDHASIRKLLIKLGGRFCSDDDHDDQTTITDTNGTGLISVDHQYDPLGNNINSMVQPLIYHDHHEHQISMLSGAAPPVDASSVTTSTALTINETQYKVVADGADFFTATVLGQSSSSTTSTSATLQAEIFEQMIFNNPQKLDGLEFLCGDMILMNNNNRINNGSLDWGEMMSCMVPNPVASSFESLQQGTSLQDCAIDDHHLRYHGP